MRRTVLTALMLPALLIPAGSAHAYVYWSDGDGAIGRADLSGAPNPGGGWIESAGQSCGVAVDGSHVYWTTRSGTIGRANLDGSGVDPDFIALPSGWACGVAVAAGHIYWASNSSGKLGRAALDGSDVRAAWMSPGVGHGCGIDVNSTHVFWATASGVYSAPLAGGPPTAISTVTSDNCGVAVNAVHIYWATGSGYIERDLIGGGPPTPIVKAPQSPCGVAVDAHYVYWGNSASDTVGRSNLDGSGQIMRFAEGATGPCGVAVDALGAPGDRAEKAAPPKPPSNVFRLGEVRKNKKRGTARLEVLLPGPGTVTVTGRRIRERSVVRNELAAGAGLAPVEIPVRPRRATRAILRTYGLVIAPVSVTFQPLGGVPRTRYTRIWLVLRQGEPRRRELGALLGPYRSGCSSIFSSCRLSQGKEASSSLG